jgi:hypothetical protein
MYVRKYSDTVEALHVEDLDIERDGIELNGYAGEGIVHCEEKVSQLIAGMLITAFILADALKQRKIVTVING